MAGIANIPDELVQLDDKGRATNAREIMCQYCGSKILLRCKAELVNKPTELPHMTLKAKPAGGTEMETDSLDAFWLVKDMFTFENIGFSNAVDGTKYLICADCEQGPVGWCLDSDRNTLYVAHDRIKYN